MTTWMVVEDEPDIYEVLLAMFEMWGNEGVAFVDGEEAIAWIDAVDAGDFEGELPELALLDIRLPGLYSGVDVGERIRRSPRLRHMAIVLNTAYRLSDQEAEHVFRQAGADKFMYKPLPKFSELQAILQAVIDERPAPRPAAPEPAPQKPAAAGKPRILYVDDEIGALTLVGIMLERGGFEVLKASDAHTGLEMLKASDSLPDLIISDVMMPGMNGIEFVAAVRAQTRYHHIPIMILSARGDEQSMVEGLRAKADSYVAKPALHHDVLAYVRLLLAEPVLDGRVTQTWKTNILLIAEEPIHQPFFEHGAIVNRNGAIHYHTIADAQPELLLLAASPHLEDDLHRLRAFDLSAPLPVVVVVPKWPAFATYTAWIEAGADEIALSDAQSILAAGRTAVTQYARPTLVQTGAAWRVLIAGPDFDRRTDAADAIEAVFNAQAIDADTRALCLEIATTENPDLILLDTALADTAFIDELRRVSVTAPVILLVPEETPTTVEHHQLNTRGIVPYAHISDGLVPVIDRLLRWGRQRRTLRESWAEYHLRATEAAFEHHTRTLAPVIAATLVETGKLFSGLIHDLRNSVYSLLAQTEDLSDDQRGDLEPVALAASVLLETIAEGRFKGTWSVRELDAAGMTDLLLEAAQLAQVCRPDVRIRLGDTNFVAGVYRLDPRQARQMLTDLLLAALEYASEVTLSVDDGVLVRLDGAGLENLPLDPPALTSLPDGALHALAARKLAQRMQIEVARDGDRLELYFPSHDWPDDMTLRREIAQDANAAEGTRAAITRLPTLQAEPQLARLVGPVALELTQVLQQATMQAAEAATASSRLQVTARYALLLAHNLLITCAGYRPQPSAIPLQPVLDTLYQLREDYLNKCAVDFSVAEGTPPVYADELALLQILVNLVTNAVEAMGGRGRLTIRAAPHEKGVEISVSDNGPGIPPEEQTRIFDLFYTTKSGHERGVGLHIVNSIVRELGGEISLHSTPGRGTTFNLIIPTAQGEADDQ